MYTVGISILKVKVTMKDIGNIWYTYSPLVHVLDDLLQISFTVAIFFFNVLYASVDYYSLVLLTVHLFGTGYASDVYITSIWYGVCQ